MSPPPFPFTELVDPPAGGRLYALPMRPGLGDCAPSGRIRLDALACWLQDVAYADVEDAGVAEGTYWVVRRTRILVGRWPRFAERFTVSTFCSGLGRMWAERRTVIAAADAPEAEGPAVEAVALWVHLDPASRRPVPFSPRELETYGAAAAARRVSARLRHPPPEPGALRRTWTFRATECDIAEHVNNAAYWQPLEEELLESPGEPSGMDVEMEFRAGAQPGEKLVLGDGALRWITDPAGEVHASLMVTSPPQAASQVPAPNLPISARKVPKAGLEE
ncbi:MAG: thioesterase [Actinomycetota bacterium]|nr:thioesterase [Actinomycetota bacterium]